MIYLNSILLQEKWQCFNSNASVFINGDNGRLAKNARPFYAQADYTYDVLSTVLKKYKNMLTVYRKGKCKPGALSVIISGNRPKQAMAQQAVRFAGYDGRLEDLQSKPLSQIHKNSIDFGIIK